MIDTRLDKDNNFECACGEKFPLDEGTILTPDPYGEPFCPKCTEEYFTELEANSKKDSDK